MNRDYWQKRWLENRIGFHRPQPNPMLERFATRLTGGKPGRVLVPLCGKSVDLTWLARHGHEVTGVELSALAIEAFAAEQQLELKSESDPPFTVFRAPGLCLYVGDLFDLSVRHTAPFDAIYDRAALIAMPGDRRPAYARHLLTLLRPGGRILLVALTYDQARMDGPPFSVADTEVRSCFAPRAVEKLFEHDCLDDEPRFKERGLTALSESVFLIQ